MNVHAILFAAFFVVSPNFSASSLGICDIFLNARLRFSGRYCMSSQKICRPVPGPGLFAIPLMLSIS